MKNQRGRESNSQRGLYSDQNIKNVILSKILLIIINK